MLTGNRNRPAEKEEKNLDTGPLRLVMIEGEKGKRGSCYLRGVQLGPDPEKRIGQSQREVQDEDGGGAY